MILLTTAILTALFSYLSNEADKESREKGLDILKSGRDLLDVRLGEIEQLYFQLGQDNEIRRLWDLQLPLKDSDYYKIQKLDKRIIGINQSNSFIDQIILYCKDSGIILSPSISTARTEFFYNINYYNNLIFEDWLKIMEIQGGKADFLPALQYRMKLRSTTIEFTALTYLRNYPLENPGAQKAIISILIDVNRIFDFFEPLIQDNNSILLINDLKGETLVDKNGGEHDFSELNQLITDDEGIIEIESRARKDVLVYAKSSKFGFTIISSLPITLLEERSSQLKNLLLAVLIMITIIGLLLSFYLSYSQVRPIRKLVSQLEALNEEENKIGGGELEYLEGTFSELVYHHSQLKSELDNQKPLLRADFFNRLFQGKFLDSKERDTIATMIGILPDTKEYIVIIMEIIGYGEVNDALNIQEREIARTIAMAQIKDEIQSDGYLYKKDEDKIVILYKSSNSDNSVNRIGKILEDLNNRLNNQYSILSIFGVSNLWKDLTDAPQAFNEARQVLEHQLQETSKKVTWFKELPLKQKGIIFPEHWEDRITGLVLVGDEKGARVTLEELFRLNFHNHQLSNKELKQYLRVMYGLITKISWTLGVEPESIDKLAPERLTISSEIKEVLSRIITDFCNYVQEQKRSHNKELIGNILNFINSEYSNNQMGLSFISDEFQMTETYLSSFFREQTGNKFTSYIEKIRINKACELLENKKVSVNDVAKTVGYTTESTFFRAFKKIQGVSPGTYQRNFQKK